MATTGEEMNPLTSARLAGKSSNGRKVLRSWDQLGIVIALLILVAFMAVFAPNFMSLSNAANVAQAVSVTAVLAAGATLVILTAGIDLSVGSLVAVTGVVAVELLNATGSAAVAIAGGVVAGGLAGLLNGVVVAYVGLPAFIVTLGALTYLRGTAYSLSGAVPVPIAGDSRIDWIGSGSAFGVPTTVIIMAIVYTLFWYILKHTRYGRHIYAVGGNVESARLSGIRTKRVLTSVYVVSGLAAGLAGVMFAARVRSGQVTAGQGYELDAIAAVVVGGTSLFGGRGSILGTLVGAFIIGVLNNGLVLMGVPFYTQLIVQGLVVVGAVGVDTLRSRRRS